MGKFKSDMNLITEVNGVFSWLHGSPNSRFSCIRKQKSNGAWPMFSIAKLILEAKGKERFCHLCTRQRSRVIQRANNAKFLFFVLLSYLLFARAEIATFCAIADIPYSENQEQLLREQLQNMIPSECVFLIHLGDLREKGGDCLLEQYQKVAEIMRLSPVPVFMLLGELLPVFLFSFLSCACSLLAVTP